jgi:hypothetical protein
MKKTFYEYLDSKKKIAKPEVAVLAKKVDTPAAKMKKPPQGVGMVGGKQPYVKDNGGKPTWSKKEWGDLKSPNVPYYDATKEVKPAKLPTAESPFVLAPIVRESIKADPRTVEAIVRDLKRNGLLGPLVGELLTHKEAYLEIASVMGSKRHGQTVCDKLARAIREVSVPFSDEEEGGIDPDSLDPDASGDPEMEEDPDMEEDPGLGDDELGDDLGSGEEGMGGPCPECQETPGTGPDGQPCQACGGTGEMPDPAGMGGEEDDMPLPPDGHTGPDVPAAPALEHLMRSMRRLRR